jgi:hypothetical protein
MLVAVRVVAVALVAAEKDAPPVEWLARAATAEVAGSPLAGAWPAAAVIVAAALAAGAVVGCEVRSPVAPAAMAMPEGWP